jgi:hypothetical protein
MTTSGREVNQSVTPTILRNLAIFRWCNGACGLVRVACSDALMAPAASERGQDVAGIGSSSTPESSRTQKSANSEVMGVLP